MRRGGALALPAAVALAVALAVGLLGGCSYHLRGPRRSLKPEGETVTVAPAQGAAVTGEFLGVRGESLVLLRGGRLLAVPLAALARVEVEGYAAVKVGKREKLLPYARYPQGLAEERWGELLRERGQQGFDAPASGDAAPAAGK
ncbi:MAG TPA: hypothetical protein VN317_00825 [Candidatus Methanoperedens sp.]|nr:hypothetical protein [Candidatus Methanoperedens sp.]